MQTLKLDWEREKRNALQLVDVWIQLFSSQAAAWDQVRHEDGSPVRPNSLTVWLRTPGKGLSARVASALSLATGIPLEACLFPTTPIRDLRCENARREAEQ